ncbi:hypothetical protein BpHYR1_012073 [Brachionus plicatilis]|uniref:Uncharacterized protein n=1 Tax=Brachionus plicatilis TaxID=10195 RepID=A0A3M7SSU1_BRAPC|nr:hypothetical protein BpHYR1_012073 [Brachionus plicatilis]
MPKFSKKVTIRLLTMKICIFKKINMLKITALRFWSALDVYSGGSSYQKALSELFEAKSMLYF